MARQRFIHPEIWKDPVFGRLQPLEQVLFIGLFSIADDDGRLNADPAYLKSEIYAYKDYTNKKVQQIRDNVVESVPSVHLYHAKGIDLIALLKWDDYQKPKYRKPSKLPQPFLPTEAALGNLSPKLPPTLEEGSPEKALRVGLGLGSDRARAVGDESTDGGEPLPEDQRPSDSTFKIPNLREAS